MFGSKINHSDLQKLEEENKNLAHKIEKFQSENLELKNKNYIIRTSGFRV